MKRKFWRLRRLQLGLAGCCSLVGAYALTTSEQANAQITPDATLSSESSVVTPNLVIRDLASDRIDGGAIRGSNLFHSFQSFSVPTGGTAFFNNPANVQNILTRVTGGSISNIDGLIRANGTANLFLLNPNGIVFGPNASLNIGGSFVTTTADAIGLANGDIFSANPGQPVPSQVLNVNPNALFFNQLAAQAIINRSTANNSTGLQVPPGQSLLLVGGNVGLEGGQIISPGSRVELGAVAGQGSVGLSGTASEWRLSFPDSVARADVSLSNSAVIDARGGGGGSMIITARNLTLSQGSRIWVGIKDGLGFAGAQAGDMQLDATETINLADDSLIGNRVGFGSTGNAGNINITTGSFSVTGNAQLGSDTFGQGNTGSININARDTVSWDGDGVIGGTAVQPTSVGNAGDFNITTGSVFITNSARIGSVTRGQGNTGSINIYARDMIFMDGGSYGSLIGSGVDPTGVGNSGGINITTGSLSLTNNAQLNSYTRGQGNTGRVNINARDTVSLDDSLIGSAVYQGVGNSGGINITTGSLSLTNNAQLNSATDGQGDAGSVDINARDTVSLNSYSSVLSNINNTSIGKGGDIEITAGSLSLTGGSQMVSSTNGQGDAGSVNINVRDTVSLDGESPVENTAIFTQVNQGAVGRGGDITITTGVLALTNGGALYADNDSGTGNAGDITIHARDSVQIRGTTSTRTNLRSGVFATTPQGVVGNGGDIIITTGSLSVSDQGRISTSTQGQGDAGNIQIQANGSVSFDGGDAISTLEPSGSGRGGDIDITALKLSLLNGAQLAASTSGEGNAGNITLSADTVALSSGGRLLTTTNSNGEAGDIIVNTPDLQLSGASSGLFAETTNTGDAGDLTIQPRGNGQSVRVNLQQGAQISASTYSSGRGGTLTLTAPESITLTGNGSIIAAGTGSSGNGGNLNLRTGTLGIQNQAQVTVSSSGTGSAGNLFVDANQIYLNNAGSIRADTTGGGGNINLRSPLILLRNGSKITTNAKGSNIPGGNIEIDTQFLVAIPQENSDISANSEDFRGGNVSINAYSIFGIQPRLQPTPSSDITATGATDALIGIISVTTAGIDPAAGLVELPIEFVDTSRLIASSCIARRNQKQQGSFIITGSGGLPFRPGDAVMSQYATGSVRTTDASALENSTRHAWQKGSPIVEAQDVYQLPSGQLVLSRECP
ncbi:two-partner secretion domain-containing protein [Scytonema sp. PRP1]|uniref:two-partner secretion domain-containing protein n=1 Tax=Scytonema sp. PRP1 TaxID=3120513 RepID=UPI002FD423F1